MPLIHTSETKEEAEDNLKKMFNYSKNDFNFSQLNELLIICEEKDY